jgi:hypothetical protein
LFRYDPEHDYEQLNDNGSDKGKKKSLHQMFAKECDQRPPLACNDLFDGGPVG